MGERPRRRVRSHQSWSLVAGRLRLRQFAGAGAAAGHRLCRDKLSAGSRRSRRRGRPDASHSHRVQIRSEGDRDLDAAQGSVREAPRRLPGLCPCDDRGPARARAAGGLCQRLSAHHPAAGQTAPAGRGRHPRLGFGVVRRRDGLDRLRSDQRSSWSRTITSSWRWDGIFPTSRRSTASSWARASRSSAWPWTCCWWSSGRELIRSPSA